MCVPSASPPPPTCEFLPGSQLLANRQQMDKDGVDTTALAFDSLWRDDVVIFDYRTVHRGVANRHASKYRPLMYQVYTKEWFKDLVNFGTESLHDAPADSK
ncbi:hypothetical protein PTSG_11804 [Salpingoeca rosetta]|uniref:Phytanoyl-CoA dioxygenase n=1 Tax=Salpingoeca rosetta (strain ATCC 50818 / BSB-021) TaxID=946362 RepID=F2TZD1_SALR5|nr:uncharacterized protein PTSG_11804 [Salpingoeca rosetta]EGD78955.1 hypothetical protein PTSG_11804 [Salpingoeca rosetta]|eukprot:XP_004997911.1 hypothetical protein PTSG_11804 [Salpingoeca rosetta]